jgi:integrase
MKRSFRSPKKQAEKAVGRVMALGKPRHGNRDDGKIHSLGTARAYQQQLKLAAEWLQKTGHMAGLDHMSIEQAQAYLEFRAQRVSQKTLDMDRHAMRILPSVNPDALVRVKTQVNNSVGKSLATKSRTYTEAQRELVHESLTAREQLASEIICVAGLRAIEILTMRPVAEQPASTHRTWSQERYYGREEFARYTVIGKGGLIREVALPPALAEKLEAQRRDAPVTRMDRGIQLQSHYNLPGGQRLTSAWSKASNFELGWSTGIHGLRHNYAQRRMEELQSRGFYYSDALAIISQEMGHFRPDITEVYLR